jgi:class 3 adenylate cyclase
VKCTACGGSCPDDALFCPRCGSRLVSAPAPSEQRKTVTALFCDVTGSTALGERLDPESLRRVLARFFDVARGVVEGHGGTIEKFIGDAVMAIFGVPLVHEDDALRAVRAAADLQLAIGPLNAELERQVGVSLQVRIGVNTGEVVTGTAERLATGDAVNVAARLEQLAAPGEVLVGEETVRLVRDAVTVEPVGHVELKGKAEPVLAFRLVAVDPSAPATARRLDAPLVGRSEELETLRGAFSRMVREQSCVLFTLLGAAGVGKSRLVEELVSGLQAIVLRGRCLSYGEGITYFPVVDIVRSLLKEDLAEVRQLLDGDRAVAAGLEALEGVEGGAASSADIALSVRKVIEAAAAVRPVVVVFEDLHWGEPTLFDLVEHVADLSRSAAVLLLCVGRPELMERRPGWGGGRLNASTLLLEPLADAEAEALIDSVLERGTDLDGALRAKVRRAAAGNPLFVEEMVRYLSEAGEAGGDVPPTIQALLAARLDQLEAGERSVLERGSVEGQSFHRRAVEALSPEDPELPSRLVGLVRKDLLRPDRALLPGDDAFRFRHLLIRDAAYEGLPKATRADLHARFAAWLAKEAPDLPELDEILGYHLEMAVRYRAALGALDEASQALAAEGARYLESAGRRAWDRGDEAATLNLLSRASALRPDERDVALELAIAEAEAHSGDFAKGATRASAAAEAAARAGDEAGELVARVVSLQLKMHTEAEAALRELPAAIERARPVLERAGDELALTYLFSAEFERLHYACRWDTALPAAEGILHHARLAGHAGRVRMGLAMSAAAAVHGSMPVPEALALLDSLAAQSPFYEPGNDLHRTELLAWAGHFDEGREAVERAAAGFAELGAASIAAVCGMGRWEIESVAGEHARAESVIRRTCEQFEEQGERSWLSTAACNLAASLYRLDRLEEAELWARRGMELGASDDIATQSEGRIILGMLAARRGAHDQALELAEAGVQLLEPVESPHYRGKAMLSLAEIHHLAGRRSAAEAAAAEAIAQFSLKGATALVDGARARLEEIGADLPEGGAAG